MGSNPSWKYQVRESSYKQRSYSQRRSYSYSQRRSYFHPQGCSHTSQLHLGGKVWREREEKGKQPHPLKQRSTRDTREKNETAKKKVSSLTKVLLPLLLRGGKVQRVLKGEALCLRQRASLFHAKSREDKQEIKSKDKAKAPWRKDSTYIHTREYVYRENWHGEKDKFHDSNTCYF